MLNLRVFTPFKLGEKNKRTLGSTCHSVQKEIIKKVKVASGSKAARLRQFSKVRSSERDFVDRCTFHCCCTLLQLCMLQKSI